MKTSGGGSPPVDSLVDLIGGVRGVHPKDSNIAKVSDADIDAFVKLLRAEDSATFDRLGRIDKEKGFRTVLKAMLEGRVPAGQQQHVRGYRGIRVPGEDAGGTELNADSGVLAGED
jgi:hypothetical protein